MAIIFCSLAFFTASIIIGSIVSKGIWSFFDIGFAINWPPDSPSSFLNSWDLAIKEGLSTDNGDMKGLSLDQKAGKLVCPKVITGTPRVSKTSNVLGISKIMDQGDAVYVKVLEEIGFYMEEDNTGITSTFVGGAEKVEFDFNAISDTFLTLAAITPILPKGVKINY